MDQTVGQEYTPDNKEVFTSELKNCLSGKASTMQMLSPIASDDENQQIKRVSVIYNGTSIIVTYQLSALQSLDEITIMNIDLLTN